MFAALLILPLLATQQKPSDNEIHALIKRLESESIEARERAFVELMKLGKRAVPLLEGATKAEDMELVARSKDLLRLFKVGEKAGLASIDS